MVSILAFNCSSVICFHPFFALVICGAGCSLDFYKLSVFDISVNVRASQLQALFKGLSLVNVYRDICHASKYETHIFDALSDFLHFLFLSGLLACPLLPYAYYTTGLFICILADCTNITFLIWYYFTKFLEIFF